MQNGKNFTKPFSFKIEKPWGFEIIFTPPDQKRTGKILFLKSGQRLSLQYHEQKEETLCLFSGKAVIWLENDQGEIEKVPMEEKKGYSIPMMKKHRVEAEADTFIFEVSDQEKGATYRLEDDYQREAKETEEDRQKERN